MIVGGRVTVVVGSGVPVLEVLIDRDPVVEALTVLDVGGERLDDGDRVPVLELLLLRL